MTDIMKPYTDLGRSILGDSNNCDDRTGAGTWSIFGRLLEFDTRLGAPFLTERKIPLRSTAGELAWFIEGSTDVSVLRDDYRCSFWNEWESKQTGTIGPMYGKQWRDANGIDQLQRMLDGAIATPNSRRLLCNTWIPEFIPDENTTPSDNPDNGIMALPPCHFAYQIRLYDNHDDGSKWIDLMFHLRSSDFLLGLPINIASYYMLQSHMAQYLTEKTGIVHNPRWLKASQGDVHIYKNHIEQCQELTSREPSTNVPTYVAKEGVLELALDLAKQDSAILPELRKQLLQVMYRGVRNYKPGEVITGARNV